MNNQHDTVLTDQRSLELTAIVDAMAARLEGVDSSNVILMLMDTIDTATQALDQMARAENLSEVRPVAVRALASMIDKLEQIDETGGRR